jgi:hypothetical protein
MNVIKLTVSKFNQYALRHVGDVSEENPGLPLAYNPFTQASCESSIKGEPCTPVIWDIFLIFLQAMVSGRSSMVGGRSSMVGGRGRGRKQLAMLLFNRIKHTRYL